ncbi:MAG: patatin-like phospholipase family protein [Hyphomicrobiales bacterium]|nr:patatin-like phospholipase family protein [Hyphomicrobiales bacterium]MBV8421240.1 patatin-like phospholipase family protein [Hyphomicrobiales bacterium]
MLDVSKSRHIADAQERPASEASPAQRFQIVLVFQGGGALGAYQAGVYRALHEGGIEPDWIIGTSIGAINASLIAGNEPEHRLDRLEEFWRRMERKEFWGLANWPGLADTASYWSTLLGGIPGFFEPNPLAFLGAHYPLGRDSAAFYSTAPLAKTLTELVDFALIARCTPRLTVGAAHVRTSEMRYFDSRETAITVQHVMASGALPPAFPAVRIDGELYWDGGILSNTPTEAIFDDNPRRDSLIFAVHMWNPMGPEPESIWEVLHRQKDIQYSSRVASHIARQRQVHKLRHVVSELVKLMPEDTRNRPVVKDLAEYGCLTRMHVVQLLAPRLDNENHTKDIDFSPSGIRLRWQAGYADTRRALQRAAWNDACDPLEGVILHAPGPDVAPAAE